MRKYRLSVCKGPDCRRSGADHIFKVARQELANRGLVSRCEAYRGGCYGLCDLGPNVVIREELGHPRDPLSREDFQLLGVDGEVHYAQVTEEKIIRVVEEHIGHNKPVEDAAPMLEKLPSD